MSINLQLIFQKTKLYATRKAFITTESCKLKLPLTKQTQQIRDFFEPGSEVFLKETSIKSGEALVLLLVRMGLLYLLDKEVYFTKFIVHEHKKFVILIFHQQSIYKVQKIIYHLQSKNSKQIFTNYL